MKKLTSAESVITVSHYRNILESEGIPAFIRNEHLGSIMGEVPFQEVWAELWIKNDLDFDRASQLLDAATMEAESPSNPWRCSGCNAENEAQFGECWQCGGEAPNE
jgi:hypothetical protein